MSHRFSPFLIAIAAAATAPAAALAATAPSKTTTQPRTVASARLHWQRPVRLEPLRDGGLAAVSCPTTSLCVAVDHSGHIVTSTNPRAGRWHAPVSVDPKAGGMTSVSCPTTRLCVATEQNGGIVISKNPTGGARAWIKMGRIGNNKAANGGPAAKTSVSCPTTGLCVATDNALPGNIWVSRSPAIGWWKATRVNGTVNAVSCTYATTDCVVAGSRHWYSSNPAAGRWHAGAPVPAGSTVASLSCPSKSLCVGVGYGSSLREVSSTTAPQSGRAWRTRRLGSAVRGVSLGVLDTVSCSTARFCAAVDSRDNYWTSATAAFGGWRGPGAVRRKSIAQHSAISCNRSLCVVVDSAGVATTGLI